jgi:hypothetical protein
MRLVCQVAKTERHMISIPAHVSHVRAIVTSVTLKEFVMLAPKDLLSMWNRTFVQPVMELMDGILTLKTIAVESVIALAQLVPQRISALDVH